MGKLGLRLLLLLLPAVLAAEPCRDQDGERFLNCKECLVGAKEKDCGWCLDSDKNKLAKGCILKSACKSPNIFKTRPTTKKSVQDGTGNSNIRPVGAPANDKQYKVQLSSRPSVTNRINFIAKRTINPIDIYFLIDNTQSMKVVKDKLAGIVTNIKKKIEETTEDYMFGFGGFDEKPTPPFDSFHTDGRDYDFRHVQSMTKETDKLITMIRDSPLSEGNKDSPEAGLDALMQLLLCRDSNNPIGWRPNVKGMIVFITNAPSHLAGDGLLGGIWKPYEHSCAMTDHAGKKVYKSLNTDYPSVSSLRHELRQSKKFVIFGTGAQVLHFYHELSMALGPTTSTARDMKSDGGDLQQVIVEEYNKISNTLEVTASAHSGLEVNIEKKGIFEGVSVGNRDPRYVDVTIKPGVCKNEYGNTKKVNFDLTILGHQDKMTVEVTALCDCNCNGYQATNHSVCNSKDFEATLNCGACNCVDKKGEQCLCDEDESLDDTTACQDDNGLICSNHGQCQCGKCKCNVNYVGEKCECQHNNLCGNRGTPQCGKDENDPLKVTCACNAGWKHDPKKEEKDCSCADDADHPQCMDPKTRETCSGNGNCECAKCECDSGFEGKWCQKKKDLSPDQINENTCKELTPCILEQKYKNDDKQSEDLKAKWKKDCDDLKAFDTYTISFVDDDNSTGSNNTDEDTCRGISGDVNRCNIDLDDQDVVSESGSCQLQFCHNVPRGGMNDYTIRGIEIDLRVAKSVTCGLALSRELLIGSSVGAGALLFIIGFLTFCIVINLRDRREYLKYMAELEKLNEKEKAGGFKDNKAYRQSRMSLRKSMMPARGVTFGAGGN